LQSVSELQGKRFAGRTSGPWKTTVTIDRESKMIANFRLAATLSMALSFCLSFPLAAQPSSGADLIWQDRFNGGEDATALVAVAENRVFTVGKGPATPGADTGWLVKAYDQRTGKVLWVDTYSGISPNENKGQAVAVSDGRVFAGGSISWSADTDYAMVRAYDAATGAVRWEDKFTYGNLYAGVTHLAIERDEEHGRSLLYAVGRAVQPDFTTAWYVRAYDARTGALVWDNVFHPAYFDDALSVTVKHGRIFVSGFTFDITSFLRHFTVRAYEAGSGALLWQDVVAGGLQGFEGSDAAQQVVAEGDRVLAAGVITDTAGYHFAVRAYQAGTGNLLWSHLYDSGSGLDSANSIALHHGRAFVVGQGGALCSFSASSDCNWLIRVYDQETGNLLWQEQVDVNHQDDGANVVLACGDQIVVSGSAGTDSNAPYADWLVQVRNANNGDLVWQNLLPTPLTFGQPYGLAVDQDRLFVTGSTSDLAGGTQNGDVIVRAHHFESKGEACEPVFNNYGFR
jgi:hypothetical protein